MINYSKYTIDDDDKTDKQRIIIITYERKSKTTEEIRLYNGKKGGIDKIRWSNFKKLINKSHEERKTPEAMEQNHNKIGVIVRQIER